MRRRGVVTVANETHVVIQLREGGMVHAKKADVPALEVDMNVVVEMRVTKAKRQPPNLAERRQQRRQARWVIDEYFRLLAMGKQPCISQLMDRAHLQLVDNEGD